jgi:hypothetical protein
MLERYADADRWLARVYDPNRSTAHRLAIWDFLMHTANDRLKHILTSVRSIDEDAVKYWDTFGKN